MYLIKILGKFSLEKIVETSTKFNIEQIKFDNLILV